MSSCDAQRFFEGALALLDAVETEEGDAFEAMKYMEGANRKRSPCAQSIL
jgi:hypothetical protein